MNAKATTTLPQRTMWFTMVYLEGGEEEPGRERRGGEIRDRREEEVGKVGEGI